MQRFALYYAPQSATSLGSAATTWLGRDNTTFDYEPLKPLELSSDRFKELTKAPYHYGFHGTLKPPFRLRKSVAEKQIFDELKSFCSERKSFTIASLEIGWIGGFLCLQPVKKIEPLDDLAADAVRQFDRFREEMNQDELEKRRNAGLSQVQDRLLLKWGYPYVMEEFRFHLTLSSKVNNPAERRAIEAEARRHFSNLHRSDVTVDGISLFLETNGEPMEQLHFFPFKG